VVVKADGRKSTTRCILKAEAGKWWNDLRDCETTGPHSPFRDTAEERALIYAFDKRQGDSSELHLEHLAEG
jgi:hypothetical protein